jgi:hypothetical protein
MYFPKSQVVINLFTNGEELIYFSSGLDYKGYYFKTSNNKYFTGKSPNNGINNELLLKPQQIFKEDGDPKFTQTLPSYYNIIKKINPDFVRQPPLYSYPLITPQDYKNGVFTRYFCKKTNEILYIEINKKTYDKLINKDPKIIYQLYQPFKMVWQISGSKEQVFNTNKNVTKYMIDKFLLPSFNQFLKEDYLKFYKLSESSNLYTAGNEFKTKNGMNYVGFYHIHINKGPMVGKTHIEKPHEYLYPIDKTTVFTTQPTYNAPSPSSNVTTTQSNNSGY